MVQEFAIKAKSTVQILNTAQMVIEIKQKYLIEKIKLLKSQCPKNIQSSTILKG